MVTTENIIQHLTGTLGIPFQEVESSNILLQGYDEKSRILYLVFKAREGQTPQWVYQYKINAIVYKNFLNSSSKGHFLNKVIKPFAICKSPLNL